MSNPSNSWLFTDTTNQLSARPEAASVPDVEPFQPGDTVVVNDVVYEIIASQGINGGTSSIYSIRVKNSPPQTDDLLLKVQNADVETGIALPYGNMVLTPSMITPAALRGTLLQMAFAKNPAAPSAVQAMNVLSQIPNLPQPIIDQLDAVSQRLRGKLQTATAPSDANMVLMENVRFVENTLVSSVFIQMLRAFLENHQSRDNAHMLQTDAQILGNAAGTDLPAFHGSGEITTRVGRRWALVMERIKGVRAAEYIESVAKQYPGEENEYRIVAALEVVKQLTANAAASEARGISSGDYKPDNTLVEPNGRVRRVDFATAKVDAEHRSIAESVGSLLKTEVYSTPGFVALDALFGATSAGDVYALAMTAYELFTGEDVRQLACDLAVQLGQPVERGTYAILLYEHVVETIDRIAENNPSFHPISAVIKMGAHWNIAERIQTCAALASRFKEIAYIPQNQVLEGKIQNIDFKDAHPGNGGNIGGYPGDREFGALISDLVREVERKGYNPKQALIVLGTLYSFTSRVFDSNPLVIVGTYNDILERMNGLIIKVKENHGFVQELDSMLDLYTEAVKAKPAVQLPEGVKDSGYHFARFGELLKGISYDAPISVKKLMVQRLSSFIKNVAPTQSHGKDIYDFSWATEVRLAEMVWGTFFNTHGCIDREIIDWSMGVLPIIDYQTSERLLQTNYANELEYTIARDDMPKLLTELWRIVDNASVDGSGYYPLATIEDAEYVVTMLKNISDASQASRWRNTAAREIVSKVAEALEARIQVKKSIRR